MPPPNVTNTAVPTFVQGRGNSQSSPASIGANMPLMSKNPLSMEAGSLDTQAKAKQFLAKRAEGQEAQDLKLYELQRTAEYARFLKEDFISASESRDFSEEGAQRRIQEYWDQYNDASPEEKKVHEFIRAPKDTAHLGSIAGLGIQAESMEKQEYISSEVSATIVEMDRHLEDFNLPPEQQLFELQEAHRNIDQLVDASFGNSMAVAGKKQLLEDYKNTLKDELTESFVRNDNVTDVAMIRTALERFSKDPAKTQTLLSSLPASKVRFDAQFDDTYGVAIKSILMDPRSPDYLDMTKLPAGTADHIAEDSPEFKASFPNKAQRDSLREMMEHSMSIYEGASAQEQAIAHGKLVSGGDANMASYTTALSNLALNKGWDPARRWYNRGRASVLQQYVDSYKKDPVGTLLENNSYLLSNASEAGRRIQHLKELEADDSKHARALIPQVKKQLALLKSKQKQALVEAQVLMDPSATPKVYSEAEVTQFKKNINSLFSLSPSLEGDRRVAAITENGKTLADFIDNELRSLPPEAYTAAVTQLQQEGKMDLLDIDVMYNMGFSKGSAHLYAQNLINKNVYGGSFLNDGDKALFVSVMQEDSDILNASIPQGKNGVTYEGNQFLSKYSALVEDAIFQDLGRQKKAWSELEPDQKKDMFRNHRNNVATVIKDNFTSVDQGPNLPPLTLRLNHFPWVADEEGNPVLTEQTSKLVTKDKVQEAMFPGQVIKNSIAASWFPDRMGAINGKYDTPIHIPTVFEDFIQENGKAPFKAWFMQNSYYADAGGELVLMWNGKSPDGSDHRAPQAMTFKDGDAVTTSIERLLSAPDPKSMQHPISDPQGFGPYMTGAGFKTGSITSPQEGEIQELLGEREEDLESADDVANDLFKFKIDVGFSKRSDSTFDLFRSRSDYFGEADAKLKQALKLSLSTPTKVDPFVGLKNPEEKDKAREFLTDIADWTYIGFNKNHEMAHGINAPEGWKLIEENGFVSIFDPKNPQNRLQGVVITPDSGTPLTPREDLFPGRTKAGLDSFPPTTEGVEGKVDYSRARGLGDDKSHIVSNRLAAQTGGTRGQQDAMQPLNIFMQRAEANRGSMIALERSYAQKAEKENRPYYMISGPIPSDRKIGGLEQTEELFTAFYAINDNGTLQVDSFLIHEDNPETMALDNWMIQNEEASALLKMDVTKIPQFWTQHMESRGIFDVDYKPQFDPINKADIREVKIK